MTTRAINTEQTHVACAVCGRTLLRGERAETYLAGGTRREVCELCAPRALHEGWVREAGALERASRGTPGEPRRSLLARLRRPREQERSARDRPAAPRRDGNGWHEPAPAPAASDGRRARGEEPLERPRAQRHVQAVPTSVEQQVATALERFNASEHPRTLAGVARSLGAPVVVARPLDEPGSLVTVVVSWELCWYRYEVDLGENGPAVRAAGQGYELAELAAEDCAQGNAVADAYGALAPA